MVHAWGDMLEPSSGEVPEKPAESRYRTFCLMRGVLGTGIGVGLVIASFIAGLAFPVGAALSSSGAITMQVGGRA